MTSAFADGNATMHPALARRLRVEAWTVATRVRAHLTPFRQAGATWEAISQASGVSLDDIWCVTGNDFCGITRETAGALLAVTLDALTPYRWDAGGSRLRIRSLMAMGHSPARIARALGSDRGTVTRAITTGQTVTYDFRARVIRLWDAWWDLVPPERTTREKATAKAARDQAARANWCTPLAMDEDELDCPGYRPLSNWLPATGCGVAGDDPLGTAVWSA